jgi:hypothetical protein
MKGLFVLRQYAMAIVVLSAAAPVLVCQISNSPVLKATAYNSHFPEAALPGEAFNGMGVAHDGTIYYVLSSAKYDLAGQMYSFNPTTKAVTHIADLNDAVGEGDLKAVAQGKSHVEFVEDKGKLYFSTHLGYYHQEAGIERTAAVPDGYRPYPGGHFLSYDMKSGKFENLGIAPGGEGIIAMNMDVKRGRLYGITWPTGHFLRYNLKTKELKDLGSFFHGGEIGSIGDTYRSICRRIVVDPLDGSVYFTTGEGTIHRYNYDADTVETVEGVDLKKDYFGQFDPKIHGMAYNWRAAVWDPSEKAIYGINGRSGYLFRFDPSSRSVSLVERLTSEPAKKSGEFQKFEYGYLGLVLGPDGHTLYYLTGGAAPAAGKKETADSPDEEKEDCHLITYDIASGKYVDHGRIVLEDGQPISTPQSLELGRDGTLYTLAYVVRDGKRGIELVSFHP